MQLRFDYRMRLSYSMPVHSCHFTIKCIPQNTKRQRLIDRKIIVEPEIPYSYGKDSFGNNYIYGQVKEAHDSFLYQIQGNVEIFPSNYEETEGDNIAIYRYPFGKCIPGEGIKNYFSHLNLPKQMEERELCLQIMHCLHSDFQYRKNQTGVGTDAQTAWNQGTGVCQDYAHIMICLLRLAGIPARYVCGLLVGEGESHAWVEALCHGLWIGFDPTNNCLVQNQHIKLGHGRDATDCAINRGIMLGGGNQTQEIFSLVTEE